MDEARTGVCNIHTPAPMWESPALSAPRISWSVTTGSRADDEFECEIRELSAPGGWRIRGIGLEVSDSAAVIEYQSSKGVVERQAEKG